MKAGRMTRAPRRPSMPLAVLRERDPEAWQAYQVLINTWLDQRPELLRDAAAHGFGREHLHELLERFVDDGWFKLTQDRIGFRFVAWDFCRQRYAAT